MQDQIEVLVYFYHYIGIHMLLELRLVSWIVVVFERWSRDGLMDSNFKNISHTIVNCTLFDPQSGVK